jgi:16S rRNA (adenine1518-N6/adenine1519-N6)-dimethyltransferase
MSAFKEPPKKSLGQHFLTDRTIIEKIVLAIRPQPGDFLVEIGPGRGAITFPLLKKHGALTVIEFDRDLITPLMESAEGIGDLTIIHKDVLKVDFSKLAADRPAMRLVGNLPYNISTPILFHVLEHAQAVRDMHFMLQKEVIDRMAAEPGSKVYGRLSVMLQARCEVTPLFLVPPSAFNPPPKVDSAIVRLQPLAADKIHINNPVMFENLVRDAFGQRRKTIRNAMQAICSSEDMEAVGIRPDLRAEQVPVADFVNLANFCAAKKATNP